MKCIKYANIFIYYTNLESKSCSLQRCVKHGIPDEMIGLPSWFIRACCSLIGVVDLMKNLSAGIICLSGGGISMTFSRVDHLNERFRVGSDILTITVKGQKIEYTCAGEGEAVVLLHGWGANRGLFEGLIHTISKKYKAIAPDLPGFGGSEEPKEPWNVGDYADCMIEFLRMLEIRKVVFLAHSFGGRIVFKLFEKGDLPFEIEKIILIDSAGIKPKKTRRQKIKQQIYKISRGVLSSKPVSVLFPEAMENLRRKNGSADYNAASPMMRRCLVLAVNEDLRHVFPKIQVPSLLIWGDRDDATPLSDAKIMESTIPDAGLVICEGAGHYSFLEQPLKCQRVIASFLKIEM